MTNHVRSLVADLRVEGLMAWHTAALAWHRAGVPMWAKFDADFPDAATGMARPLWGLLKHMGNVRYNYRRT